MNVLRGGKIIFGSRLYDDVDEAEMKQIGFKCGVMYKKDEIRIKRIIFRISKGLSVFHTLDEEGKADQNEKKVIFYLFFGFGTSDIMQRKINRTLEIYCFKMVDYPKNDREL